MALALPCQWGQPRRLRAVRGFRTLRQRCHHARIPRRLAPLRHTLKRKGVEHPHYLEPRRNVRQAAPSCAAQPMNEGHARNTRSASHEVIDAIAGIETRRRQAEKETGLTGSCSSALRKLHDLLDLEKESLQLRSREAGNPRNVEAVAVEIARVKGLAAAKTAGPAGRSLYPPGRKIGWRNAHRSPSRNRGRRTMGRAGGR